MKFSQRENFKILSNAPLNCIFAHWMTPPPIFWSPHQKRAHAEWFFFFFNEILHIMSLLSFSGRHMYVTFIFKCSPGKNPAFCSWVPRSRGEDTCRSLRNSHLVSIPKARIERYGKSPIPYMVIDHRLWNQGPGGMQMLLRFSLVFLLKGHWTSITSSPNFFQKKLRFLYHYRCLHA